MYVWADEAFLPAMPALLYFLIAVMKLTAHLVSRSTPTSDLHASLCSCPRKTLSAVVRYFDLLLLLHCKSIYTNKSINMCNDVCIFTLSLHYIFYFQ